MDNIILKEATDKLKLLMNKHPHPYKIWWLKKEHEILITSQHLIIFIVGNILNDEAL